MLIKKELLGVLPGPVPERPTDKQHRSYNYCAAVNVVELPRSGKVLVADFYSMLTKKAQEPIIRFFSDGTTFQVLTDLKNGKWCARQIGPLLRGEVAYCDEAGLKLVETIVNPRYPSWRGREINFVLDDWISGLDYEKRQKANDRKIKLQKRHFAMYPPLPENLAEYCENNVFQNAYIFIEKAAKGMRKAVCSHCGERHAVSSAVRPGAVGICPKCGRSAKYRGSWFSSRIEEKEKICIAEKADGQLLLRWVEVERIIEPPKFKPRFNFNDHCYNLHLNTPSGPTIYAYQYTPIMYRGYRDWVRQRNGCVCAESAYVYTENLDQVFGDNYHNVSLKSGFAGRSRKVIFQNLLKNIRCDPRAEYLFKLKMPSLAAQIGNVIDTGKSGFTGVLGVSKQLMPLYAKHDVRLHEHHIIAAYGQWISEENLLALREMRLQNHVSTVGEILSKMSLDRFIHYFHKQKALLPKKDYGWLLTRYRDYISMSRSLHVDLSHKSVLLPRNVKEAHDAILGRFNEVKHEAENELFAEAVEQVYAALPLTKYEKDGYCIVLPRLRSDLITEGQSLNHCVGGDDYFKRHIAGTNLIFFVREAAAPQKPFFTMEVEMGALKIKQLYGFGDRSAPKEVRTFAEAFVQRLKPGKARKTA